jgi:hypothetical protein
MPGRRKGLTHLALEGCKSKHILAVPPDDPVHSPIAEVANPVKKDHLFSLWYFHDAKIRRDWIVMKMQGRCRGKR